MDENQFHLQDHEHTPNHDDTAEALIASLKAVINDPNSHNQQPSDVHDHETDPESSQQPQHHEQAQNTLGAFTAEHHSNPVHVGLRKSLAQLTHLTNAHQGLLDELNGAGAIQNLAQNLKALKEGNKRQIDVLKELTAQIKASELGVDLSVPFSEQLDPELSPVVLRSHYDALKAQYDALLVSGSPSSVATGKRQAAPRRSRAPKSVAAVTTIEPETLRAVEDDKRGSHSGTPTGGVEGRKKRSIRLEHLVHKMANRRLGVEYTVSNFESKGSRDLPDPATHPLTAEESPNGVDEFRPHFGADINASTVKPFIDIVIEDVWEAWQSGQGDEDVEADRQKVFDAVKIYWTRLSTQDHPDSKRAYTPEEWYAYRRLACGPRSGEAHEVIDQFWLSPAVRTLLLILDEFAQDQQARAKKKGKPKQPNPIFHLPPHLWDRSTLPTLRPKDNDGLPLSGSPGIILFKFHVDEQVQRENPDWAKGLYDNPPIPPEDEALPKLSELLSQPAYAGLRQIVREAKDRANPKVLTNEQVEQINSGVDLSLLEGLNVPPAGLEGEGEYITFAALTQLASNSEVNSSRPSGLAEQLVVHDDAPSTPNHSHVHSVFPSSSITATTPLSTHISGVGPSPIPLPYAGTDASSAARSGTSMRARKLGKRAASEFPGGAATPVPKRQRVVGGLGNEIEGEGDGEVEEVLGGDAAFLEGI
ncbi:hypothetical protein I307_04136 [Cryptococcus deuterogattii 99/473]|uniref:Uncharacterized protein n=1 Tax=Cryptococcus deuterogattii Ram5 TaxID=1296110 RepID=A0A0D0TAC8_9TREE|nr:hypothetical protein I309_03794 [Cryptococcus deuterogattii LA55]KIR43002.1 hypothetical protein I313_01210 [Cryptococcus deuterogattii Ram5]KIR95414.1 hypothetical protein I304_00164 [Cryptococcus deuterogattii CBS 10090]KIY56338.1 hypothetical protein I307_04136 [Cryptococcus deuterogattii 99/473]